MVVVDKALVAIKAGTADTLTVLFCGTTALADQQFPTYKTTAESIGQTCKKDGANIYYGSAAAVAVYDTLL